MQLASGMRTADEDLRGRQDRGQQQSGDPRDWVFDLLDNPRYRGRLDVFAGLDLTRRAGCEQCLHALVTNEWDYEALYHLGWCESCRKASFALGTDATPSPRRMPYARRAVWVVLAAGLVIAAPLAGNHFLDERNNVARGGSALPGTTTPANTNPTTTPATTPTTTPSTTPTTTPRHRRPRDDPTTTPSTTPTTTRPRRRSRRSSPSRARARTKP